MGHKFEAIDEYYTVNGQRKKEKKTITGNGTLRVFKAHQMRKILITGHAFIRAMQPV